MSEFDKEAERERLREKFDRDKERRKSTQRMSELLLKGATMTNQHCETCGDPIFRYDGQEFCPTCQAEAVAKQGEDVASEATTTDQESSATEAESTASPSTESPKRGQTETANGHLAESAPTERAADAEVTGRSPSESDPQRTPPESIARVDRTTPAPPVGGDDDADLAAARQSLGRTLTRFAREAERTEDPRRASDLLAAAREAAETLAALDRR